jgi:hypothetical protein
MTITPDTLNQFSEYLNKPKAKQNKTTAKTLLKAGTKKLPKKGK